MAFIILIFFTIKHWKRAKWIDDCCNQCSRFLNNCHDDCRGCVGVVSFKKTNGKIIYNVVLKQ